MHRPVEFSICGSTSHDAFVDIVDSIFSFLVCSNGSIDLSSEGIEVLLVLGFDFCVFGLVFNEPGNNLVFVEIECECLIVHGGPLSGGVSSVQFLVEASLKKRESSKVEH